MFTYSADTPSPTSTAHTLALVWAHPICTRRIAIHCS